LIVLDASVLIAHLNQGDAHHKQGERLFAEASPETLGASPISLAEALVVPAGAGLLREAREAFERLRIVELTLGADAEYRLAELRAETGRKLPDCCVLLAAKEIGGVVATFDAALTEAAAGLNLRVLPKP